MSQYDLSKFVGIPFVNRGRNLTGCDCYGLARLVWKEMTGSELPDYLISCMDSLKIDEQVKNADEHWIRYEDNPPVPSIVAFRFDSNHPDWVTHFGVYVGDGMFIHTRKKANSCKERLDDPKWKFIREAFYIPKG
jgi:cell wall-associated NlpC family hydrolase